MSRDELLKPKPKPNQNDQNRTVLSIAWHPRLQFLQKVLHQSYTRFTTQYPTLKTTFPDPPMVAFRKNRSFRDILTHARHGPKQDPPTLLCNPSAAKLEKNMSASKSLTNEKTGVTVKTVGGNAITRNIVYAAKCKRCELIYVGHTTIPMNERFNIHRSDISKHPDRSELPKHFSKNPLCEFDRDLEVHILEKDIVGNRSTLESREDRWILRLDTLSPNGLNSKLSEHGITYKKLFT